MKVLVPHWFDDTVRLAARGLPTSTYEWPDPIVLRSGKSVEGVVPGVGADTDARVSSKISGEKKALYKTALMLPGHEVMLGRMEPRDIWEGRRILITSDMGLSEGRRQVVEAGIVRYGGAVIACQSGEEEAKIDETDVLITRYRYGNHYIKVYRSIFVRLRSSQVSLGSEES